MTLCQYVQYAVVVLLAVAFALFQQQPQEHDIAFVKNILNKINISVADVSNKNKMEKEGNVYVNFSDISCVRQWLRDGNLGIAETYIQGKWDTNDLVGLYDRLIINKKVLETHIKSSFKLKWYASKAKYLNLNTLTRSQEVIKKHYNIGNELFSQMLGPTMQYTCAYWKSDTANLNQAQKNKMTLLAKKLNINKKKNESDYIDIA